MDYTTKNITKDQYLGPLPDWTDKLCENLQKKHKLKYKPDQVIINEYVPGHGISHSIDNYMFDNNIFSLSLGSD